MGPKEKIERLAQTPEDRVLLARVWERLSAGQRREIPAFSCFLSLREQELVRRLMGEETLTFFGGYPEAERAVACYLPPASAPAILREIASPIGIFWGALWGPESSGRRWGTFA